MADDDYKCMRCRYFDRFTRSCRYWEPGCFFDDEEDSEDQEPPCEYDYNDEEE